MLHKKPIKIILSGLIFSNYIPHQNSASDSLIELFFEGVIALFWLKIVYKKIVIAIPPAF